MDQSVALVLNRNPKTARAGDDHDALMVRMQQTRLRHLPLIDDSGRLAGLETLANLLQKGNRENWVVLMAGGEGRRLRPLTSDVPKPMLPVGSKPILETIMDRFIAAGFHKFLLSVNYKAGLVETHFGDGSSRGVEIDYLREDRALGTAGPLGLLPERPNAPFFVMNGDILTNVDFGHILDFHRDHHASATMCVYEYRLQVPYGVVSIDGHNLVAIDEKPTIRQFVNAGIYVLEPQVLDCIDRDAEMTMPQLFQTLMAQGHTSNVCPIREYWLDVGQVEDLQRANREFSEIFND
jgi:NDP-sugar pyrophosphorylase family protein